jgi:hypothetical protein
LCKIIQTLNGPKPDLLHLDGGGLQRSLGKEVILRLVDSQAFNEWSNPSGCGIEYR